MNVYSTGYPSNCKVIQTIGKIDVYYAIPHTEVCAGSTESENILSRYSYTMICHLNLEFCREGIKMQSLQPGIMSQSSMVSNGPHYLFCID